MAEAQLPVLRESINKSIKNVKFSNFAPPSPKLFKAWLISELMVFAQTSSELNLVTIRSTNVIFTPELT